MEKPVTVSRIGLFCLGLLALIPLCLVLWGMVLPAYAKALGAVASAILRGLSGAPIDGYSVEAEGLFNTGTRLAFEVGGRQPALDVGALVFNVPPFVALMVLTPGLRPRRRALSVAAGTIVLALGHTAYIVLAFLYAPRIAASPEIPTALGEVFLTLPFLLWILLGYWDRLAPLLRDPAPPAT